MTTSRYATRNQSHTVSDGWYLNLRKKRPARRAADTTAADVRNGLMSCSSRRKGRLRSSKRLFAAFGAVNRVEDAADLKHRMHDRSGPELEPELSAVRASEAVCDE